MGGLMGSQIINTSLLLKLNPEYAEALARGEDWAVKHASNVESINRKDPHETQRKFDGKPRRWCGSSCGHKEGCIVCTLRDVGRTMHRR